MTEKRSGLAVGVTLFAATMLIVIGFFQAMQGLVALVNDTFYVAGQKWVFEFDVTTWGWIHLILGIVVALAGVFVLVGQVWARVGRRDRGHVQRRRQLRLAAVLPRLGRSSSSRWTSS